MDDFTAVLLDVSSIQKYIFGSNRLKDNIGASHIVENLYDKTIKKALEKILGEKWRDYCELDTWREKPDKIALLENEDLRVETAFEGGGKAMLLFREKNLATIFVRTWTRLLLLEYPGIRPAVAIEPYKVNGSEYFKDNMERIFYSLSTNKQSFIPQVEIASHGITYDCPRTGLSAQIKDPDPDKPEFMEYISSVAFTKINHSDPAKKDYKMLLGDYGSSYVFPERFDQLGQMPGNNYMAIIHMDGNSMGQHFKERESLESYRRLAKDVKNITKHTVKNIVKKVIILYKNGVLNEENGFDLESDQQQRLILPILPIIVGGDDVTIICHGFLGVFLAEYLLTEWVRQANDNKRALSACAGVAIIPGKYPFFRAYTMAEQLCSNAKKFARKNRGSSWLDFHLPFGAIYGDLDKVRSQHLHTPGLNLNFGPYYLHGDKENIDKYNEQDVFNLQTSIKHLSNWPRSKCKELRSALAAGETELSKFLETAKKSDLSLPEIYTNYHATGTHNGTSPYFEALNLMEFYPLPLIKESLNAYKGGNIDG